jgi:hypothetical protein
MDHDKIEAVLKRLGVLQRGEQVFTASYVDAIEKAADLIRDLRTEIDNQETKIVDLEEKVPEWMPIDYEAKKIGAPWDGKPVLVYCKKLDPYVFQAQWRAFDGSWAGGGEWVDIWNNDPIESESGNIFPHLWQPQPSVPSDKPELVPPSPPAADNAALIAAVPMLVQALQDTKGRIMNAKIDLAVSTKNACGVALAKAVIEIDAALASIGRGK